MTILKKILAFFTSIRNRSIDSRSSRKLSSMLDDLHGDLHDGGAKPRKGSLK